MTLTEFENTASELTRLAMVSKEIGKVELIDVTKVLPKWADEIKNGFKPSGSTVKVNFMCDLSNDYIVCVVTNGVGWSYEREVDFSPKDGDTIASLVHPDHNHAYNVTF